MRKMRLRFGTSLAIMAAGTLFPLPGARAAVVTNVWQTAAGGSIHTAANWVGAEADWTDENVSRGFLDFRALSSGASVTMSKGITFSGFWFGLDPEVPDPGDGPYRWNLPSGQVWNDGVGELPLRVDDGELFFNGKISGVQDNIHKQGNGTLVVCNSLADSQEWIHNLLIDEGEVRIATANALRNITFRADDGAGTLTVSNNVSEFFIGRIYSIDTNREPRNLEGQIAHIGGAVADSVIAVPSTNGTYVARGQYTLMLGSTPEATELRARDGDLEICTLTNTLRDCVGFWRFENPGDPLHDSGMRANTLVANGAPQVVADSERGNVLYLDGASYLSGRTGNSLNGIPVTNTPYTVAFWVKMPTQPSVNTGFAAFHWGTITGNKCNFLRFNTNGKLYHSHGDGSNTARNKTYGGSPNPFDGAWHHVVIIHVGDAQMRYYIDGELIDTADWSAYGTPEITRNNFEIGNPWSSSSVPFVGYMDDFLILDHALSADEVVALHAGQTDTPNYFASDLPYQSIGNGSLRLGCDQTFDTLRGDTFIGGVRLQNGATLTIDGGSPATATQMVVRSGIHGSGSFRKDGANLDLVPNGLFDYSGDTEVAAGTLTLRTASDLAGWWQFEDPDDLGRSSERVNALDVGKYSATQAVNDPARGAVVYASDGANCYAVGGPYTGHTGFPVGNSPYTCAVWVKRDADCPNNGSFFWWGASGNGKSVQFRFINSYQKFALAHVGGTGYDFTGFDIGSPMPAGEWHHVAATYNGDKVLSVYYDGRLVKRETTAKAIDIPFSGTVIVGKYSGRTDRTFKGLMDDARIYSRCLTDAEIAMLAAESGEPAQYDAPIRLPSPVAWYTFDDPANPGKDSSANGYDLTPVGDVNVVSSPIKGGMLSLTGTTMSYLKYADDAFPAKIPYGTKSLTIACWARLVKDTRVLGPAVAWGEAVTTGSHSTILDMAGRTGDLCWRFVTLDNSDAVVSVTSQQSSFAEGADDLRLHHVAGVYDTANKQWLLYVDGELTGDKNNVNNGCATPASNFYVGRKPSSNTAWFRGELDEVRVYDVPLAAEQIRELIRCDLAEGRGVLPPSTTVTVAQGATLRVDVRNQSVEGLEGTGAVMVNSNAMLRLASDSTFAGSLTGGGELALAVGAAFPSASLAGFTGTVVLDGGKLSGAVTPASCGARIADGAALALADAPFASVGGTLTVGGSGTFTWTGAQLAPGDYPIATAGDIVLEQGTGWQASPAPGGSIALTALSVQNNGNGTKTLLFRVISGGTLILFR